MFSNGSRRSMADNKTEMAGKKRIQREAFTCFNDEQDVLFWVSFLGGNFASPQQDNYVTLTHTHK
jgi:hypothetical protein